LTCSCNIVHSDIRLELHGSTCTCTKDLIYFTENYITDWDFKKKWISLQIKMITYNLNKQTAGINDCHNRSVIVSFIVCITYICSIMIIRKFEWYYVVIETTGNGRNYSHDSKFAIIFLIQLHFFLKISPWSYIRSCSILIIFINKS